MPSFPSGATVECSSFLVSYNNVLHFSSIVRAFVFFVGGECLKITLPALIILNNVENRSFTTHPFWSSWSTRSPDTNLFLPSIWEGLVDTCNTDTLSLFSDVMDLLLQKIIPGCLLGLAFHWEAPCDFIIQICLNILRYNDI